MLIDEFDLFLFDLDGVIYVGSEALPGAIESMSKVRKANKTIRFITNDPCTTREKVCERLQRLGIEAHVNEMITASFATAQYVKSQGITTAFVLGDEHLISELQAVGVDTNVTTEAEAVVVGWDSELTFHDVQEASLHIHHGAQFIVTSADRTYPTPSGPALAVGAIAEALTSATGVKPKIIGKPGSGVFTYVLEEFPTLSKEKIVMIGDNPETDILGAHQVGITAILISENSNPPYPSHQDFRNPDLIIPNLNELFTQQTDLKTWDKPSYSWPEHVKAGVAAIIVNENKEVLLMKRVDNGYWGLPCGHIEPGESAEQAVIREVREETGLQVQIEQFVELYSDPTTQIMTYPNGTVSQFVTASYLCTVVGGTLLRQTTEAEDVQYFSRDQLPDKLMPMHFTRIQDMFTKWSTNVSR